MKKLHDEIKKILIFSNFAEQEGGEGKTEEEIATFKQRAIDCYLGKISSDHDIDTIKFNRLHARVEHDTAMIIAEIHEAFKGRKQ